MVNKADQMVNKAGLPTCNGHNEVLLVRERCRFREQFPGLVQSSKPIKLVFVKKHLSETTKSMVCKSSVFMDLFFHPHQYVFQFFILGELLACLTGRT
jgi:hypothetical protein